MSGPDLRARILAAALAVDEARDELCRLDAVAGDGDHGVTMALGARAVRTRLDAAPEAAGADLVTQVALGMGSIGGAIGPIWASGLLKVAAAIRGAGAGSGEPTVAELRSLGEAFEGAIVALGHATRGDKTILDAVGPAVDALRGAEGAGISVEEAVARAVRAADDGARSSAGLVASLGRASRLGERSRGSPDPGASSFALILAAFAGLPSGSAATPDRGA
ncbi:MAG TPA: DAK2 domain-containing protein [Candidatus Limnocylindrales bacterium]